MRKEEKNRGEQEEKRENETEVETAM